MSVRSGPRHAPQQAKREARRPRYLWSSPAPERRGLSGALVFVIVAGLVAAVGMLYLLQTNHVARLGYEMSSLQEARQSALVEQQQLQAELARLESFNRVDRAAKDLGLAPIDDHIFLEVQAPERAALDVPADPEPERKSIWERFWERLSGRGSADGEVDEEAMP